jgi:hypothetical protein
MKESQKRIKYFVFYFMFIYVCTNDAVVHSVYKIYSVSQTASYKYDFFIATLLKFVIYNIKFTQANSARI